MRTRAYHGVETLYRQADADGLKSKVFQFSSRAVLHQYRDVYQVSMRYLAPGVEALDWGCGNGHFGYFLLKQQIRTTGFSFQAPPDYLLEHPAFTHVRGRVEEPTRLPFDDARFDLVFSIGVLEHVHETGGDEWSSLVEIRRILRPGGHFLCFHFPNRFGWTEPVGSALGLTNYFHKRKYVRQQIADMTRDAGYELVEWGRYNFLPRNQLGKLPAKLSDTRGGAALIDSIDSGLSTVLRRFTQNHYFVARKLD